MLHHHPSSKSGAEVLDEDAHLAAQKLPVAPAENGGVFHHLGRSKAKKDRLRMEVQFQFSCMLMF